jgi:energy-coupling factor transporter ATP-binding protein EcfA2
MTRWWKCDLQVATPGEPRFKGPDNDWSPKRDGGRTAAADRYMVAAAQAGLEVLVLADHNSVEWVDTMIEAGRRHGVIVFPGFEVTSATGSDGAHAVIFGGPERTASDLRGLLFGACGFGPDDPLFNPSNSDEPAPSPRTLPQILDALPEGFLAIAPHVFGQNGLVSKSTVHGTLRWKALHHDRLGAVDVGDVDDRETAVQKSDGEKAGDPWKARFIRRELNDFPCLPNLAFVSTSDAYSLESLGTRYTWIRMTAPTLEGMRQAFLDHGARIVCDWDARYYGTQNTPNTVSHSWVEQVALVGLTTTRTPVTVALDPRLTVLIGGRGAGKSTIVAALRCLYGDVAGLPTQARAEARQLETAVFSQAVVSATHHLAHSGERQTATWSEREGSQSVRGDGQKTPTDFKVRVISQKELFERAANTPDNPHATSHNLLVLVDDALAAGAAGPGTPRAFDAQLDETRTAWVSAARLHQTEQAAVAQRTQVAERVEELRRQVAAFDNEANRVRRARNDQWLAEARWLDSATRETEQAIAGLDADAARRVPTQPLTPPGFGNGGPGPSDGLAELARQLNEMRTQLRAAITAATSTAIAAMLALAEQRSDSEWQQQVTDAAEDSRVYLQELAALGLDPTAYGEVRDQLREQENVLADLDHRAERLPELEESAAVAWAALEALYEHRHVRRQELLDEVARRSGMLRFTLQPASDTTSWVERVRELLSLRSDGFLEEVPALAEWLWAVIPERDSRLRLWRRACITGDLDELSRQARLRTSWAARLRSLDPLVRTRLAAEVADETVSMEFRRDRAAGQSEKWEALTAGSPGQRSAAMLSFVLHHGNEPLVLDQPEDDLDTEWITQLVVAQLRNSRWNRQVVVVSHNANIPVNADAERIIVLENTGDGVQVRTSAGADGASVAHCGAIEDERVRADIQQIMEGGVDAFVRRERRYNNELSTYRAAMQQTQPRSPASS